MDAMVVGNVPTVIGMRWPIPDSMASILSREFYKAVFSGLPFDFALYLAKRNVYSQFPDDPAWAAPILVHQFQ
jgi:hypothetical protein